MRWAAKTKTDGGNDSLPTSLPLLEMQRAYYIGRNAENGGEAFLYFEIDFPDFDPARFESAWLRVWQSHEALRVAVREEGTQEILCEVTPQFEVTDLRALTPSARDDLLVAIRRDHTRQQVQQDPLVQVRISLLTDDVARLHFRFSLLLVDGQGLAVLLGDLAEFYADPETLLSKQPSFTEAVWALDSSHPRRSAAAAWWRSRLDELPGAPELPAVSAKGNYPLCRRRFELSSDAWRDLREAAGSRGLTPSMAVCAALAEVVGTYSTTSNFLMALMLSARPRNGEFDRVVGNFSTLALLPISPEANLGFTERALSLQERFFSGMEHSAFSGLEVLSELNRRHDQALTTGAPIVFSSNLHLPVTTTNGSPLGPFSIYGPQWIYSELQTPQVLLDVSVSSAPDKSLVVHWDSREALFPPGLMEAMAADYLKFLERLAHATDAWDSQRLPLAEEQSRKRAQGNATTGPVSHKRLHELFFDGLAQHPERVAVIGRRDMLSHDQLATVAYSIAAEVTCRRIGPNRLVAVVLEKGWEQVATVLGILHAGAAYLPVDPSLPKERRFFLLHNSEAALAITTSELEHSLEWPSDVPRHVLTDAPKKGVQAPTVTRPAGNDLAYVIFTSGSTGTPKGVMIEHEAAVNTVVDINTRFQITNDDRVFGISALNFDLSVWDIFGVLGAGGALVLPESDMLSDPAHWYETIQHNKVTVWNSAPPVMQLLVEHVESIGGRLPSTLRLVMLSGDWIPTTLPDRIRALSKPGIEVVSLGGATEASIWSVIYPISRVSPEWASIPYGKPLSNQSLHVLDSTLMPRPEWVLGDIYIGGQGLARGYWRDAERTAESFITLSGSGERLYKTGDMGRYLPDGNIEFLGRRDNQIKLRGYRIELGEIESLLARHPEVTAAAAGIRTRGGERILAAYCVAADFADQISLTNRLMEALAGTLPNYMVPQMITLLPALPLSSNGKIDRKALAQLELKPPAASSHSHTPLTEASKLESQLTQLIGEILDRDVVDPEDNFFHLGGHSFAAVRLMTRIRQVLAADLSISALLRNPNARGLARLIEQGGNRSRRLIVLREGGKSTPVFFVHAAGGNVLSYQRLSEALPHEIPFFAFEAKGLAIGEWPHDRIERMAADYTQLVASEAGSGPVILGGWSSGGVVAFEMAHQLIAAGIDVSHLVLVDTPATLERDPVSMELATEWFATDMFGGEAKPATPGATLEPSARLRAAIDARLSEGGAGNTNTESRAQLERAFEVFRSTLNALRAYEPKPLSVPTTLFKAQGPPIQEFLTHPALHRDDWGWGDWLTNFSKQPLSGNHYQILDGQAVITMAQLLTRLARGNGLMEMETSGS